MNISSPLTVTYPITASALRYLPIKAEVNRISDLIVNNAYNGNTYVDFDIFSYNIYDVFCLLFTLFPDVEFIQQKNPYQQKATFRVSWSLITVLRSPRLQ